VAARGGTFWALWGGGTVDRTSRSPGRPQGAFLWHGRMGLGTGRGGRPSAHGARGPRVEGRRDEEQT
jgi:hypothetical protein